jgi:hypothetical protein
MNSYWIIFEDGSQACCQGRDKYDACLIATHKTGKEVKDSVKYKRLVSSNPNISDLPYPAEPCIWKYSHPVYGETPSFCYSPGECKGKSCCHKNPCCTE